MPFKLGAMASIEKRKNAAGKITSWRVVWYQDGKKSQSFKAESAALKWKALLDAVGDDAKAAERALLRQDSRSPSFAVIAESHMDRLVNVREYTVKRYRGYLRNHLSDFSDLPIDKITEDDLIRWIKRMRGDGLSPKTIANVHGFIHTVMETAVRRRLRPDNPCNGRLLPKDDSTEDKATFLTMAEISQIIDQSPEWQKPMWWLLIGSGLRLGEATALTPADFQLDAATPSVRITKSYQETGEGWTVGPPKTKKARRTVSLAPSTVAHVRARIESMPRHERCFPLTAATKTFPQHRQWLESWHDMVTAAETAEVPLILDRRPRIHDIRHSHASMMIAAGMNLYELANRLGHESITTTTNTYGHLVPDAHFRAAAMVETALTGEITA